jgi:NAD(P)H-hydrate epimerase
MTELSAQPPQLPLRDPNSHKGDYGRAVLIGGSTGMTGALGLAGMAALRSGAGLVTLATPDVCLPTVAAYEPSYMTVPLASDCDGRISAVARERIGATVENATAIGCGPGIGRSPELVAVVQWLFAELKQPAVFDADALFALAQLGETPPPQGPRILTPHPGEFARLTGQRVETEQQRIEQACQAAERFGAVVVLKGHRTVVTDGPQVYVNETGNPGMATGGSGDVLTGVITALLCQVLDAFAASQHGVYLHGLAGDMAAESLGQVSLTARDLIDFLPDAFLSGDAPLP